MTDVSFCFSVIDSHTDLTLPITVRSSIHCMISEGENLQAEFHMVIGTLLHDLISQKPLSSLRRYRDTHPVPKLTTLRRLVAGCGDSGSLNPLYDKLASLLPLLNDEEIPNCIFVVDEISRLVKQVPVHYHALLRHEELWRNLVLTMRQLNTGLLSSVGQSSSTDHRDRKGDNLTFLISGIILYGLRYGREKAPTELIAFVSLLVKVGLLEFLEIQWTSYMARVDPSVSVAQASSESLLNLYKPSGDLTDHSYFTV